MCRLTLYLGPPIRLSALLTEPVHSLIRQSTHAREREEPLNGDGFGVGWYAPDCAEEPAVFRSITPAWNNRNLHNLARVVSSGCILAHVRAATESSGVNEANCHPFRYRRYLCMHNGDVSSFRQIRRALLNSVDDEAFGNVYGSTDSEHFFALVIDELRRGNSSHPLTHLADSLNRAIWRLIDLVRERGAGQPCYMNVAVADGDRAVVARFTDDADGSPESLYYFTGQLYHPTAEGSPARRRHERSASIVVASERLTEHDEWREIPPNHIIALERGRPPRFLECAPTGVEKGVEPLRYRGPVECQRRDRTEAP